jgi:hypothetical protein
LPTKEGEEMDDDRTTLSDDDIRTVMPGAGVTTTAQVQDTDGTDTPATDGTDGDSTDGTDCDASDADGTDTN